MRALMSLLTAGTVLWHAVFGCCAHHEHAVVIAENTAPAAATKEVTHCCGCKRHAQPTEHSAPSHSDAGNTLAGTHRLAPEQQLPESPCDGEECSFMVVKIVTPGDLDLAPSESTQTSSEVAWAFADAAAFGVTVTTVDPPPPLRTHLVLGILLI